MTGGRERESCDDASIRTLRGARGAGPERGGRVGPGGLPGFEGRSQTFHEAVPLGFEGPEVVAERGAEGFERTSGWIGRIGRGGSEQAQEGQELAGAGLAEE